MSDFFAIILGFGVFFTISQYFCCKFFIEAMEKENEEILEHVADKDLMRYQIDFEIRKKDEELSFFRNVGICWIVIIAIIIIHVFFG